MTRGFCHFWEFFFKVQGYVEFVHTKRCKNKNQINHYLFGGILHCTGSVQFVCMYTFVRVGGIDCKPIFSGEISRLFQSDARR